MPRRIKVAAAQVGAVHRTTPRAEVLARLIKLVEQAAEQGVKLAVFREWGKGVVYVWTLC
jgi:predicted amidohydrolase